MSSTTTKILCESTPNNKGGKHHEKLEELGKGGGGESRKDDCADGGGNHRHVCGAGRSQLDCGGVGVGAGGHPEPADEHRGSAGVQGVKPCIAAQRRP